MNRDLTIPNSLLCRTANNRQLLFGKSKLNAVSVGRKNQTTDRTANCLEIQNSYIENSGFPDFVEVVL